MDEKIYCSTYRLKQIAKLPKEAVALAEKYKADKFENELTFTDSYIPKVVEIYYENDNSPNVFIKNGELKDYRLSNLGKNTSLIAVKIDEQWAYIQIKNREVVNRLNNVAFPDVAVNQTILFDLVSRKDNLQQQLDYLQQKFQENKRLIENANFQDLSEVTLNLSFALGELKVAIEQKQKIIEELKQQLKALTNHTNPTAKNTKLQNWKCLVETKVKKTAKNLHEKSETDLTPKADKLKSQIEMQIQEFKNHLHQQISTLKSRLQS